MVEDRVCSNCHGAVAVIDVVCRHCGTRFAAITRPSGSFLNDFFRLLLGVWALALPVLCLVAGLTSPKGWGDLAAYATTIIYFIPWMVGIISLLILAWLTQERR
jgi:Na+/proline symporter